MTQEQRAVLSQKVINLAFFYEKNIQPDQVSMYVDQLASIEPAKAITAIDLWLQGKGSHKFFPKPFDLIELVAPPEERETPEEIASKIVRAVKSYGYNNPYAAMSFLGPVGWEVASSIRGSWTSLCETLMERETNTFLAQARELARVKLDRKEQHERYEKIQELSGEVSAKLGHSLKSIEA